MFDLNWEAAQGLPMASTVKKVSAIPSATRKKLNMYLVEYNQACYFVGADRAVHKFSALLQQQVYILLLDMFVSKSLQNHVDK